MPLYPPAVKMLLPENTTQPKVKQVLIILHTNASNGSIERLFNQFQGSGQECHFQLETGVSPGSHRLAQYMDTDRRADNNSEANSFMRGGVLCGSLSIETADLGQPYTKSWTDLGQRRQLEDLLVWLCQTHGIPPIRATGPFGDGIGYHCMWGFNRPGVPGDSNPWTSATGKICPGPAPGVAGGKIGEFNDLLAAVARRVAGEDIVTPEDIAAIAKAVNDYGKTDIITQKSDTVSNQVTYARADSQFGSQKLDNLTKASQTQGQDIAALKSSVAALQKSADAILAALQGASIPVSGTVTIGGG